MGYECYDELGNRSQITSSLGARIDVARNEMGDMSSLKTDSKIVDNLVTWIFKDGFVPSAKITNEGNYSIISDYL
ncbi:MULTISPECIES: hypothetical protein [Lysinibacillus]|uniref:hypothetical protein n=1 Tax=Lysinibacillus TaxID=400634 RepID=UPI001CBD9626|nr:hypothetical protein [Lysinibacillus sphaericus]